MPTEEYKFKSDALWTQYQTNQIDQREYLRQLEQLKDSVLSQSSDMMREYDERDIYKYENERGKREREIASQIEINKIKAEKERRIAEENFKERERLRNRPPQEKYREEVPQTIERYRDEAKRYRNIHNFFQWLLIIGPILATSATSALIAGETFRYAATAISILVSIAAGATGYYKFRERSFYLQQTADAIEQEYTAIDLGISFYKELPRDKALTLFAERIENLKLEQKKRQQQLEQPPETKQVQG